MAAPELRPEYVEDVPYVRAFVPQIAPPTLRLVAALNGVACPPEEDFDYCELGTAHGDSLVLFAAASPNARFVGADKNPEHVAFGTRLAERGNVPNVRFIESDFAALAEHELPSFDFVVAHGILSWVSPGTFEALVAFAAAKLKEGGLFYVSYNALPGWASIEPLRRVMLDHTADMPGTTLERAREGVAYLQRLLDSGAGYFGAHPTARSMVALMQAYGTDYVVHEYFHEHHRPMYFADVARQLGSRGLSFVGQVPLHLNVRELATPPSIRKIADGTADRAAFEMLKDFAAHELLRCDVYVKGTARRSADEVRFFFESTPFGLVTSADQVQRTPKVPFYTLDFKGPAYDAILRTLERGPKAAMELGLLPELLQVGQSRIGDLLRNLVLGGQVVPMRPLATHAHAGRLSMHPAFNRVALEEATSGTMSPVLASPATGNGVRISLLEALGLWLLTEVPSEGHAPWLREYALRRGMPLRVGERAIKDADELVKIMPRVLDTLRAALPALARLGVIQTEEPGFLERS